jgi:hypothetical protein
VEPGTFQAKMVNTSNRSALLLCVLTLGLLIYSTVFMRQRPLNLLSRAMPFTFGMS